MQLRGFAPVSVRGIGMGLAIGCGVLLVGCPQQTNCADPANATACGYDQTLRMEATSGVARVVQGDQASLEITLDWPDAFAGGLVLEADDTPSGVNVEPVAVQAQEPSATLQIRASTSSEQGIYPIRVIATPDNSTIAPVEIAIELVVAGVAGSADTSFDYDGQVSYGVIEDQYREPRSAMDPNGSLLVWGEIVDGSPYILRVHADASVDSAFVERLAEQTAESEVFFYSDVVLDADGNILSVGWFRPATDVIHGLLERRDAAGEIDTSFGNNGRIVVAVDYNTSFGLANLLVRKDDFVILYENTAYAYLPSGELNPAFGDEGLIGGLPGYSSPFAMLLPDDNILWLAQKTVDNGSLISNAGATALDTDVSFFRSRLSQFYDYCFYFRTRFCRFDAEERILCPGSYSNDPEDPDEEGTEHAFLVRMNQQGEFDSAFGEGGLVVRPGIATSNRGLAVLQNGQILVSEYHKHSSDSEELTPYLGLYNEDGSIDENFGTNGRVTVPVYSVALHVDETYGRVTFAGTLDDRLLIVRRWL